MSVNRSQSVAPTHPLRGLILAMVTTAGLSGSVAAWAQSSASGSIGLDLGVRPRYQGALDYRVLPTPVLALSGKLPSGLTVFAQGLTGGIAWPLSSQFSIGPLIGVGLGRNESDAPILQGTGDISTSFEYGAFVRWHVQRLSADLRFLQSAHAGYGNHAVFGVSYVAWEQPSNRVTVSADTVWSNGAAEQTLFGIDETQSLNSAAHLPVYTPSAGLSRVDFKVAFEHRLNARWSLRAAAGVGTLMGDAADSPIVQRRTNAFGSVGVAYHF